MGANGSETSSAFRKESHAISQRQWGIVATWQLRGRGVSEAAIGRAVNSGRLHRIHPGVYSVVPTELLPPEAWLAAAILAGGRCARLFGHSAAHRANLTKHPPSVIHIATRHHRRPVQGVRTEIPSFSVTRFATADFPWRLLL